MATLSNTYLRANFIPVNTRVKRDTLSTFPDILSSKYINLIESVRNYNIITVTSVEEFRPDIISKQYYGTEELWWVICQFNGVVNPLEDLYKGLEIKIPKYQDLVLYLQSSVSKTNSRIGTITTL